MQKLELGCLLHLLQARAIERASMSRRVKCHSQDQGGPDASASPGALVS